jgi:DNA-directed RNA polymerase subunit K/omega
MSSKKKIKKKKTKKYSSDSKLSATENTEKENSTEIEIIDDSQEENEKYDELLDESMSEISSDNEIDDKECIYYEKDTFFENKELIDKDNVYVTNDNRITRPILTKYEFVRILEDRIKQLTLSAKPLLKNINGLNDKEIAILEIKNKVCPFKIERPLPNGQKEVFKLSELTVKTTY